MAHLLPHIGPSSWISKVTHNLTLNISCEKLCDLVPFRPLRHFQRVSVNLCSRIEKDLRELIYLSSYIENHPFLCEILGYVHLSKIVKITSPFNFSSHHLTDSKMTSPGGEKKRRDKGAALVLTHFPDLEANIISIDIMMNLFKSLDPGFLSSKLFT